jgi:hypothetical protein
VRGQAGELGSVGPTKTTMADAPRFRCLWSKLEGTRVFVMKRDDWNAATGTLEEPIGLDIETTPVAAVARDASVVAAVAHKFSGPTAHVSIYRNDPADDPTPINKDDYTVWTNLAEHSRLTEMIAAASTCDNDNFRSFCRDHVFLVKLSPGEDHWLKEVPSPVKALMKKK